MQKVDLANKFSLVTEYWQPRVVGELNGQFVKIARLKGEFIWHRHEKEDELFYVHRGRLTIKLREKDIVLDAGQFFIVPRGIDHMPVARDEVEVVLFEPASVVNTGDVQSDKTIEGNTFL